MDISPTSEPKFKPGDAVKIVSSPADFLRENIEEFAGLPVSIESPAEWIRLRGVWAYDCLVEGTECGIVEADLESA